MTINDLAAGYFIKCGDIDFIPTDEYDAWVHAVHKPLITTKMVAGASLATISYAIPELKSRIA